MLKVPLCYHKRVSFITHGRLSVSCGSIKETKSQTGRLLLPVRWFERKKWTLAVKLDPVRQDIQLLQGLLMWWRSSFFSPRRNFSAATLPAALELNAESLLSPGEDRTALFHRDSQGNMLTVERDTAAPVVSR